MLLKSDPALPPLMAKNHSHSHIRKSVRLSNRLLAKLLKRRSRQTRVTAVMTAVIKDHPNQCRNSCLWVSIPYSSLLRRCTNRQRLLTYRVKNHRKLLNRSMRQLVSRRRQIATNNTILSPAMDTQAKWKRWLLRAILQRRSPHRTKLRRKMAALHPTVAMEHLRKRTQKAISRTYLKASPASHKAT